MVYGTPSGGQNLVTLRNFITSTECLLNSKNELILYLATFLTYDAKRSTIKDMVNGVVDFGK